MTPGCPSPEIGRRPDAPAPRPGDADARNREQDAFDDYLDARHEVRRTGSPFFAYVADVLFRSWHALRRRDEQ